MVKYFPSKVFSNLNRLFTTYSQLIDLLMILKYLLAILGVSMFQVQVFSSSMFGLRPMVLQNILQAAPQDCHFAFFVIHKILQLSKHLKLHDNFMLISHKRQ